MPYMVVGEYPDEYVDEEFRSDIKVLDIGISSPSEAKRLVKMYTRDGFTMLHIYEYREM